MSVRIHHLNCGTLCPLCERLMNGGSWLKRGKLVCHCPLIEADDGLVLIDSGLGTRDIDNPSSQLGRAFLSSFKPRLAVEETAIHQIRELGYDPRDVRHIVPTHLDLDHIGGLSDFPEASVHICKAELQQIQRPTRRDRIRFRQIQFEHQPRWVVHEQPDNEWFGFNCTRPMPGLNADILMVPLVGHTKGHVGVAVKQGDKWLLHCGDAYYHHTQMTTVPKMPLGLKLFEKAVSTYGKSRLDNLARLQRLAQEHADEIELFCAHDPVELMRYSENVP